MKYIISSNGCNIGVGLLDPTTAEEDINLAHNIFNTYVNRSYYNGVLNFTSVSKFYRFLINKYFLQYWQPNKTSRQILRSASNKARSVINNEVEYRPFLPEIYQHNQSPSHVYKWTHFTARSFSEIR